MLIRFWRFNQPFVYLYMCINMTFIYACPVQSVHLHAYDTFSSSLSLLLLLLLATSFARVSYCFLLVPLLLLLLLLLILLSKCSEFVDGLFFLLFHFRIRKSYITENNPFEVKNEYVKLILKVLSSVYGCVLFFSFLLCTVSV